MANYISQVTLPNGTSYNVRELFPHVGNCTDAAATAAKTVTIGNFKLYTGAWVVVKFSNTNSAAVASLTLNVDGTGAKPIKYRNANLSSAGLLIANRYTHFIYDGTNYQIVGDFDTNSDTYDRNQYKANIKAGTSALVAGNIIVGKDGVFNHLKSGGAFDISYPILYLNEAVAASATTTNTYDILHITITTTQSITLTAYKPIFIKGTLSGTIFTPVSTTPLTQTIPTTDDGYAYIYLGNATGTTTFYMQERHPIYAFKNNAFGEIVHTASNVNGYTVGKSVPSDAVFTDTKVTSAANHYTPATTSGQDKTASASGATAAWSIDVVKGITLNTDGKGHVTGISVTSGKIPGNPVPSNNVTGSGTSGYLTKWNGTNTITKGPQLGSSTTTFLRNDGSWATPPGTYSHPTYTERSKDIYKFHVNTLGHVDDATALDKTDVSTLINKLDTGLSTPVDADYYISQYVGGGATTTSYHRRPMSALWSYVKSKADSVYLPIGHTYPLSIAADSGTNQLTLSASTKYKLTAGGSTFVFTTPPDTKNTAGSTDTSSKIYLVGATSQAANPQTYSDNEVYVTSGVLTTKKVQVGGGSCTMEYNSTTETLDFIFT